MNKFGIVLLVATVSLVAGNANKMSATDLALDVYEGCLKDFSVSCVKPRAMAWIDEAIKQNEILITDQMSIVRTSEEAYPVTEQRANGDLELFDKVDRFLATHALRVKAPEFFSTEEARSMIPSFLSDNPLTKGALVPLSDENPMEQGRGFVRKVMLPFLLGLKLKTTVLVPLALALIALKTWKAMTLGLLSLVLSGALVIFKIAKPKVVNYEVVHYPHHVDHVEHLPHHVEHIVPHHLEHHVEHIPHHVEQYDIPQHYNHIEHVEHIDHPAQGWEPSHTQWARSSVENMDAQDIAYAGQQQQQQQQRRRR
ncbi:uncharacterized protein LOC129941025 [Eupeodes corollae]|uniref:uncharacterized protein LOC129941025 n=1 Tax=Eupeodes corollae TaxID=290404 RepID=UPI002492CCFD|nr:uncharacterized protein LOC129941025 [Eupeodes corollae]